MSWNSQRIEVNVAKERTYTLACSVAIKLAGIESTSASHLEHHSSILSRIKHQCERTQSAVTKAADHVPHGQCCQESHN